MREGWVDTTFASLLTRRTDVLGSAREPRLLTVTEHEGLVDQFEHWGRRVATEDVSKYKVVDPNDVVYNVYLLWAGAIGQNRFGERGITSPVYEVFTPSDAVVPEFMSLILTSPAARDYWNSISIGSIQRRRRAPWQQFLRTPAAIPPLAEQRRIVDLIAAVDDAIEAAEAEAVLALDALEAARDALLWSAAERQPLSLLGDIKSKLVDPRTPENSGLLHMGVDRIESVTGDVINIVTARVDGVISRKFVHTAADVIYSKIRPNLRKVAVPDWTGLASADAYPIRPAEGVEKSYLRHVLASRPFTALATSRSGRTKMPKINKADLFSIEVPVHGPEQQAAIAASLDALDAERSSAAGFASALRSVRSELLTACLSGDHIIPDSYDALLEV